MRPHGNNGVSAILCPCISGSKTDDDLSPVDEENAGIKDEHKSPFAKKKTGNENDRNKTESTVSCVMRKISAKKCGGDESVITRHKRGGTDHEEITFEFERHSNASSLQQVPSLHTEGESGHGRDGHVQNDGRIRSMVSRHSVDDAGSYRSALRIDRTPSLSYCSEIGVAKSSSVLVNLPSSRGSLSSLGRMSARRSPSPNSLRKDSLTHSYVTDTNTASSNPHINRMDTNATVAASPSWSGRNVISKEYKSVK